MHLALAVLLALYCSEARADTGQYLDRPDAWFAGAEGRRIADNILSWQSAAGSWPKNEDVTSKAFEGDPADIHGTFDNNATTDEIRFLTRSFNATHDPRHRDASLKGLDHILAAQYPTGGWPQFHPPGDGYHRHITFNDHTMVRLMELLRDVVRSNAFAFVGRERRIAAQRAFDRGVDCILRSQVVVKGKLTAWCAQHDEMDLTPRPARVFEPVSLSGCETVGIVRLLMSIEKPDARVRRAVHAAVAWLESVKLRGLRVREIQTGDGLDRELVREPTAEPIWARFYEIGTNRPLFVGRDGVVRYELGQIDHERRNGYAWLGAWSRSLLEREYPAWKQPRTGR